MADTLRVHTIELEEEAHRCLGDQEQQIRLLRLVLACLVSPVEGGVDSSEVPARRIHLHRRIKSMLRTEEVSACRDRVLQQLRLLRLQARPEPRSMSSVHYSMGMEVEGSLADQGRVESED